MLGRILDMKKQQNRVKTETVVALSKHQIHFCPICYHMWNLSSIELINTPTVLESKRVEIDPVFALQAGHYAFVSMIDVLLHLYHAHGLQAVLNEKLVEFLNVYRLRGPSGLAKDYAYSCCLKRLKVALGDSVNKQPAFRIARLLQAYWKESERRKAYNSIVAQALTNKRANIYGLQKDLWVDSHAQPLGGFHLDFQIDKLAYLRKERKRMAKRLWYVLTDALGVENQWDEAIHAMEALSDEDCDMVEEDGYVFMQF